MADADKEIIPLATRYQGAWYETQARGTVRDQILSQYLVVSSAILGVALANESLLSLALVVPFVGFIVALMLMHNDIVISALNRYAQRLEKEADLGKNDWFTSPQGLGTALWAGAFFQTSAALFAVVGLGAIALYLTREIVGDKGYLEEVWYLDVVIEWVTFLLLIIVRVARLYLEQPRASK